MRALDVFQAAIAPKALSHYADYEGEWQELDEAGWQFARTKLLGRPFGRLHLIGSTSADRFDFDYCGLLTHDSSLHDAWEDPVCAVSFQLTTEYLKEHGPDRVRALALQLAELFPLSSGHAGLALCGDLDLIGVMSALRKYCFRYPGLDIVDIGYLAYRIGSKVHGPAWLNFLGRPALDGLGGVAGLRSRLHSPGTTVDELPDGRAVITLGPEPDAGDNEQGNVLPAYRELARVLEPWLYLREGHMLDFTPEEAHAWRRRFLD
ncbi:type VI immunity family protein [Pyxidicoccus xibeiensis]|uniref:type VI immunity family protein n=1 Tax=Pyxidicoccus xibeiensis TaxID=2906759 RepID=UPI0020A75374|nr:type VI immunity family protein [Pyxidicoccus xibeiensis]MCP3143491.1 DUF3396 domain-containing protein [Pyxidicoccus xibeiensis]